jgi:hypothetical protein
MKDDENENFYPGEIQGWVLCRLTEDNKLSNLIYGQFIKSSLPPQNNWVYLSTINENLTYESKNNVNGLNNAIQNYNFNASECIAAKINRIKVEVGYDVDYSLKDKLNTDDYEYPRLRYFRVTNSPLRHIDGKYVESGTYNDCAMFRNAREWVIVKIIYPEIPELGILAINTYKLENGMTMTSMFNKIAG